MGEGKRSTLTLIRGGIVQRVLHAWQGLCDLAEQCLDVMPSLGGGLDKHNVEFFGFLLALLGGDLPPVVQIGLVAHQHDDNIVTALGADIVDPLVGIQERVAV